MVDFNLWAFLALYLFILIALIFSGIPVAFALGGMGIITFGFWIGMDFIGQIPYLAWNAASGWELTAIPLFIVMGTIFTASGIATKIYGAVQPLICRLIPGGLIHTNIVAGAIFGAASGSSVASTSTLSLVALPELEKRGYQRGLSAGSLALGGVLSQMIPPSMAFIIYGAMTGVSVGKLFIGGIFPGLLLAGLSMGYVGLRLTFQPRLGAPREPIPWSICLKSLLNVWPILLLILAIMGSIYLGFATPTEAAAMGALGAIILAALFRRLSWNVIKQAGWDTVRICSMVLLVVALAKIMGTGIAMLRIPDQLLAIAVGLGLSKYVILVIIAALYFVAGCLMDSMALYVMTIPILFPIFVSLGFDPLWTGIWLAMVAETALLTPPVGMCLFLIQGFRPNWKFSEIAWGAVPFWVCILIALFLITAFPQIGTWLPSLM
jgi:tripartite ATP-independent transporter DctM subunit